MNWYNIIYFQHHNRIFFSLYSKPTPILTQPDIAHLKNIIHSDTHFLIPHSSFAERISIFRLILAAHYTFEKLRIREKFVCVPRHDLWKINPAYVFKAPRPLPNSTHVREISSDGVVSRKCRNKARDTHTHLNLSTLTLVDPWRRANGFPLAPSIFHRSVFINHSPLSGCCSLRPWPANFSSGSSSISVVNHPQPRVGVSGEEWELVWMLLRGPYGRLCYRDAILFVFSYKWNYFPFRETPRV